MTSETARGLGFRPQASHAERGRAILADPAIGVDLGARYLAELARELGAELGRVAAGYNAGPGTIRSGRVPIRTRERYVPEVVVLAARYAAIS